MTFTSMGDGLSGLVQSWAKDDEFRWRMIEKAWAAAAGDAVGERAVPESFENGILTVRVEDHAWIATLKELEADLLRGIRRRPGGQLVRKIVGAAAETS